MSPFIVGVDFDGTLVEYKFPEIGQPVPGAFRWCQTFQEAGARLILWTMRSDLSVPETHLYEAVNFCRSHGLSFWAVNDNPEQVAWTTSRKVYFHTLIDDANAGCPLIYPPGAVRPMVDWAVVGPCVMEMIRDHNQGRT